MIIFFLLYLEGGGGGAKFKFAPDANYYRYTPQAVNTYTDDNLIQNQMHINNNMYTHSGPYNTRTSQFMSTMSLLFKLASDH